MLDLGLPHGRLFTAGVASALLSALLGGTASAGGTLRVWPTAVVVSDSVRLDDLCELRGFDAAALERIGGIIVADAPVAGGSRVVHVELVRTALKTGGINMGQVTLGGATECAITRPANPAPPKQDNNGGELERRSPGSATPASVAPNRKQPKPEAQTDPADVKDDDVGLTLRRAVLEHFNGELARYRGSAEVTFDHTSENVLELSGPSYEFRIRRRGAFPLGLIPVEVDVVADGVTLQTVPLVVQVTMTRAVLVARRSINQDAAISASDVELVRLGFVRVDELGLDDAAVAVGQRAKRVIAAGTMIESDMLAPVPLVLRGQLVTVNSVSGPVRVVTTGKAMGDGLLDETVKVKTVDDRRSEFDAIVIGPGEVAVGMVRPERKGTVLVDGGSK